MDFKAIHSLIKEMNQSNLTLLEIEENGTHIKMQKESLVKNGEIIISSPKVETIPIDDVPLTLKTETPKIDKVEDENCKEITSPIVGTFYSASAPDKPPLVKVGDKIKKGQTLCIIEAMKLMNEIESDYDGEIVEILVKNEQPVQYGQPLFKIKEV